MWIPPARNCTSSVEDTSRTVNSRYPTSGIRVIDATDKPSVDPLGPSNAGTKSPVDEPRG
jgi:hypothetical protein